MFIWQKVIAAQGKCQGMPADQAGDFGHANIELSSYPISVIGALVIGYV